MYTLRIWDKMYYVLYHQTDPKSKVFVFFFFLVFFKHMIQFVSDSSANCQVIDALPLVDI